MVEEGMSVTLVVGVAGRRVGVGEIAIAGTVAVAAGVLVVGIVVAVRVGVLVALVAATVYSICNRGAFGGTTSS